LGRRRFLQLLGIGGAGAVLAACEDSSTPEAGSSTTTGPEPSATKIFSKPEEPLLKVFGTELGTPWFEQTTFVTPHDHFFVRNRYASPVVDSDSWRLKVVGDAIETPMELSYDDLLALPARHAPRVIECFGNGRTVNREQLGHEVMGGNWGFSDVSQGEWDYVPIAEILSRVKPKAEAVQLLFWSGVDGPDTGRPIAMQEILDRADVIGLAYGLNGRPLPPDHGGPVRALVPGWAGAASVKWLTEINISTHRFWTRMHTKEEALIGPDYPAEQPGPGDEFRNATAADVRGIGGTWQNVKSWLTLPLVMRKTEPPGRYPLAQGEVPSLPRGRQTIRGYSNSPFGIKAVDFSLDGGSTWQPARLVPPLDLEYSWVRFEFDWDATPGTHTLMTRATDKRDNVQPATVPFNELGILCNAIPKFEVKVQ